MLRITTLSFERTMISWTTQCETAGKNTLLSWKRLICSTSTTTFLYIDDKVGKENFLSFVICHIHILQVQVCIQPYSNIWIEMAKSFQPLRAASRTLAYVNTKASNTRKYHKDCWKSLHFYFHQKCFGPRPGKNMAKRAKLEICSGWAWYF